MCEIADLIFEANKVLYKNIIQASVNEYSNGFYHIERFYDNDRLTGIFIHIDLESIRYLVEGHYIGKNHIQIVKYWKKLLKECQIYRARVARLNDRMIKFYKNMKFEIIKQDDDYYYFEFRR